jgi:hypothetical protein
MAINPNTTFTAGSILTAAEQNRFGFGIVALGTNAVSSSAVSAETLSVTSNSFTAIANRYYKITYFEPTLIYGTGTTSYVDLNIRLTSVAGTLIQNCAVKLSSADRTSGTVSIVKTLTAGSTVVVGCFDPEGGGTATAFRASNVLAYIVVEDVGPA